MRLRKVIMAFDSFKGSMSSRMAGESARDGVLEIFPDCRCDIVALGDGGEGTAAILGEQLGGKVFKVEVDDPLGRKIVAEYVVAGDTVIIEVASASGLTLLSPEERNPMRTSSYGTGQLIEAGIVSGFRKFVICLGGSATNDAGVGMLQALGFGFKDKEGKVVSRGGEALSEIYRIDYSGVRRELKECDFTAVCDVDNPLYGSEGASSVYGPQKGADDEMVSRLDDNIKRFSDLVATETGRDYSSYPGAGAAGGIGYAILSFLKGRLVSGIDAVLDAVNFDDMLRDVNLVMTGEGMIDSQTGRGKVASGVCGRAKKYGVPVVAFGGTVAENTDDYLMGLGFKSVTEITEKGTPLEVAIRPEVAKDNLRKAVVKMIQEWDNRVL